MKLLNELIKLSNHFVKFKHSILTGSKQSKNLFGGNSLTYGTPCFDFLLSPRYIQDNMSCQWSSSDLPRVLRIWESVFYSLTFFTLHSFLLVLRLPRGRQLNLNVSRALCWSSKHSPGPSICLNHNNPQTSYSERFSFKAYHIIKKLLVVNSVMNNWNLLELRRFNLKQNTVMTEKRLWW